MDSLVAEGLGKRYYRGRPTPPKGPWRRRLRTALRQSMSRVPAGMEEFWALRDASFRVQPGTILGVIGANGAGKTTLLKVLARVTAPTTGRVRGVGRVVSLLEIGAGFDPDLPARENVLMNAAMLGFSRHEALRRLDEILRFAEVEQFAESPLKHYSSGMYLRLAFSSAINMDPDILLADEILAVGDQAFQERCLEKVVEGGRHGLTVLFVSHDMDAIVRVCNRVMWINQGQIILDAGPEEVVDEYQGATWARADATLSERGRQENRFAQILSVRLLSADGREIDGAPTAEDVFIRILLRTHQRKLNARPALDLKSRRQLLFRAVDTQARKMREMGVYEVLVKIPANMLADTTYVATVNCLIAKDGEAKEFPLTVYNALTFVAFSAEGPVVPDSGKLERTGLIAPKLEFVHRLLPDAVHA